jgi:hypothetical protein
MPATTPNWLARHGGDLRPRTPPNTWAVFLGGEPLYQLAVVPVKGQYGCKVMQTNNGRRLDDGASHPTVEAALNGGLEDLRKALGW